MTNPPDEVHELTPLMSGVWIVHTQKSTHVWDLDDLTYERRPGLASSAFAHDRARHRITEVGRWPRVGDIFVVFFDDPQDPRRVEQWRQSSEIARIARATPADLEPPPSPTTESRPGPQIVTTADGGRYWLSGDSWNLIEMEPEPDQPLGRDDGELRLHDLSDWGAQVGYRLLVEIHTRGSEGYTMRQTSPVVAIRSETPADRLELLAVEAGIPLTELLSRIGVYEERLEDLGRGAVLSDDEEARLAEVRRSAAEEG